MSKEWELNKKDMALVGVDLLKETLEKPPHSLTDDEAQVLLCKTMAKAAQKKLVEWLKKEDAHNYTGLLDNPEVIICKLRKEKWQELCKELGIE